MKIYALNMVIVRWYLCEGLDCYKYNLPATLTYKADTIVLSIKAIAAKVVLKLDRDLAELHHLVFGSSLEGVTL